MKVRKCGHPLTPENTACNRGCLICAKAATKRYHDRLARDARARRNPAARINPRVLALIEECRPIYEAAIAKAKLPPLFGAGL